MEDLVGMGDVEGVIREREGTGSELTTKITRNHIVSLPRIKDAT